MSTVPWPHRVTFLAPKLWVPIGEEGNASIAGHLLATILSEHFLRHPMVAVTDVEDQELADDQLRLLDANHPRFTEVAHSELWDNRRDEVLWFELALYPPVRAILHVRRRGVASEAFVGVDDGTLSGLLQSCLSQWLSSRWLPPTPLALEPFTLQDFFHAVHQAARILELSETNPVEAASLLETQYAIRVPFLRFVDAATKFTLDAHILQREPDNPKALYHQWLALPADQQDKRELKRVLALAPQWGKPYLSMTGSDVTPEDSLAHHAIAARLMPRSVGALDAYAMSLRKAGRFEDAYRTARRATRMVPTFLHGHLHVLYALQGCYRHGEAFLQSQARARVLADAWRASRAPIDRARRDFLITVAHMTYDVGRLADAIQGYKEAIEGIPLHEQTGHKIVLRKWETDPATRANAFARDAHYRNDPGGVVHGYGKGRIEEGADTARLVAALTRVGREDAAAVAYGTLVGARAIDGPTARLAGAEALILAGDLARAYDEIQHVQLRYPQYRLESHVNRLLRLASPRPIYEWDAILRERNAVGATRLARLAARDAADFSPQMERSGVWRAVMEGDPVKPFAFDREWMEPMKQAMGQNVLVDIDLLFHRYTQPTLEHADRLANDWWSFIAPRRPSDPTADAQTLYVIGQALCRYLALSTQPPTVLAGGYRQVATDAMLSASRAGVDWMQQSIRPFLGALERVGDADPWLFDAWLLRVERALDLDFAREGTVRELSVGLSRVPQDLRGDERVAFELQLARDLIKLPDGGGPQALALLERGVRATGAPDVAAAWSARSEASDAHHIAVALAHGQVSPLARLARSLVSQGRSELAFDAIARGIGAVHAKGLPAALRELAIVWGEARFEIPLDPAQARAWGEDQLRLGKPEAAVRALRWAAGASGGDPQALRALATACARAGRLFDCAVACGAIDRDNAARLVGQMMLDAKQPALALPAFRLAMLMKRAPDDGALAARAAREAGVDLSTEQNDPARRAWQALADGDVATARAQAASGQSWPLTRAAVTAASLRTDADAMWPVAPGVRGQIDGLLAATSGHADQDASIVRVDVLRLREDATYAVDPPPPLAARQPRSVLP